MPAAKKATSKKTSKEAPKKKTTKKEVKPKTSKKTTKTVKKDELPKDSIASMVASVKPFESKFGKRLFGDYKCKCGNEWKSSKSYEGRYQKCMKCRAEVYPTNLVEIIRKEEK